MQIRIHIPKFQMSTSTAQGIVVTVQVSISSRPRRPRSPKRCRRMVLPLSSRSIN